jgi:hypothetical protein
MEEVTISQDLPEKRERKSFFNEKRRIVFIYIPIVALASSLIGLLLARSPYVAVDDLVSAVVYGILVLMWCKADAAERGYKLSRYFPLAVVLFSVFALVYYLFRSRGFSRGLASTGLVILYLAGLFVVLMIVVGIIAVFLIASGVLPRSALAR